MRAPVTPRAAIVVAAAATMLLVGPPLSLGAQPAAPRPGNAALADTLVRLGVEDQENRAAMGRAMAANDTAFMRRMMQGDSARTRILTRIVRAHGWPGAALVGKEASHAAWLVLQHSDDSALQRELLPTLERLADRGEVSWSDLALLTDRVLVRQGEPQRYGNAFRMEGGRMIAEPIADPAGLDARRRARGLPPMRVYVRTLGELYGLPVEWPPKP